MGSSVLGNGALTKFISAFKQQTAIFVQSLSLQSTQTYPYPSFDNGTEGDEAHCRDLLKLATVLSGADPDELCTKAEYDDYSRPWYSLDRLCRVEIKANRFVLKARVTNGIFDFQSLGREILSGEVEEQMEDIKEDAEYREWQDEYNTYYATGDYPFVGGGWE